MIHLLTPDRELRFWSRIGTEMENGCWPWVGGRNREGYGRFSIEGRHRPAHCVSMMLAKRFPPGARWEIDHVVCRNKWCVNPDHLEWVPIDGRENTVRHQATKTHCAQGHAFTSENTYRGLEPRAGVPQMPHLHEKATSTTIPRGSGLTTEHQPKERQMEKNLSRDMLDGVTDRITGADSRDVSEGEVTVALLGVQATALVEISETLRALAVMGERLAYPERVIVGTDGP